MPNERRLAISHVKPASKDLEIEDQEIEEALSLMDVKQIRRLPILNRDQELVGIVSLGDLAVHSGEKELVGDTLKEVSRPALPRRP